MMLRESSQFTNEAVQLKDVTAGLSDATAIEHAPELVAFAEAVTLRDTAGTTQARAALRAVLDHAGFVDACAIVAAFHGFTRVADATGIPYTSTGGEKSQEMREQAGINAFFRIRADENRTDEGRA